MKISEPISLEFSRENALRLLALGASPKESPYSHKQISEWCDKFWCKYLDVDTPEEIEALLPILTDVDTQWDLYLVNTYSIKELQEGNFESVCLPTEWFDQWLEEANAS
jgi:hypothetical protein